VPGRDRRRLQRLESCLEAVAALSGGAALRRTIAGAMLSLDPRRKPDGFP
jgi:hypothetical protein